MLAVGGISRCGSFANGSGIVETSETLDDTMGLGQLEFGFPFGVKKVHIYILG